MILRENAAGNSIHIGKTLPQARAQCANRDPDTGGEGRNGENNVAHTIKIERYAEAKGEAPFP